MTIDIIKEIVLNNSDMFELGDKSCAPNEDLILSREQELKCKLPNTYKDFLREFGGGEILGDEIYSIYQDNTIPSGDITYIKSVNIKNSTDIEGAIFLLENSYDEIYYFKVVDGIDGNEYQVFQERLGEHRLFANNFTEFIEKIVFTYS